ncbi:hypothetical protein GCM10020254_21260 [Streptomyces goshikiensis]
MSDGRALLGGMIDEFLARDLSAVEEAVRKAAAVEIMPRFRQLADHEVDEKSGPHDLVTVADRKAEEHLTAALTRLLPGSAVVGEEAVHADPAVYGALRADAPVWIVDPVDGTRQFVNGDPAFCTLVALAVRGEILASWTFAPPRWRNWRPPCAGRAPTSTASGYAAVRRSRAPRCGWRSPTPSTPARRTSGPCPAWTSPGSRPAPAARPAWST